MRPPVGSKRRPLAALSFLSRSYFCAGLSLACYALSSVPQGSASGRTEALVKMGMAPAGPCKTKGISLSGRCLSPFSHNRRAQVGREGKPGHGSAFSLMGVLIYPIGCQEWCRRGGRAVGATGTWATRPLVLSMAPHIHPHAWITCPCSDDPAFDASTAQFSLAPAVVSKDFLHVCLPWKPHIGMLLSAELPRTPPSSAARVIARVTAAEQQEQFGWLVHCVLVTPMTEDEMHEWLSTPPE